MTCWLSIASFLIPHPLYPTLYFLFEFSSHSLHLCSFLHFGHLCFPLKKPQYVICGPCSIHDTPTTKPLILFGKWICLNSKVMNELLTLPCLMFSTTVSIPSFETFLKFVQILLQIYDYHPVKYVIPPWPLLSLWLPSCKFSQAASALLFYKLLANFHLSTLYWSLLSIFHS